MCIRDRFERGNSADLISKLNEVISDPELHQSMKRAARIEFEDNFTADHNFQKLMDIYALAIENARTGNFNKGSVKRDLVELNGAETAHQLPSPHGSMKPQSKQKPTHEAQEEVGSP